ncbi:cytochrome oxidase assembly protein [Massilia sp. Dwa41.01b]|uniref:FixH family protein n=1 Tax=Massilia sp. Dwa41.01b TaxID=2709302 RepID=UPI001603F357|nr:FixH family protein [Massilia sp. Dwa41.01b]QNA89496.1 cytochrome oxidase assembly protein [Massilia sp. Dwa41.01b]
MSINPSAFPHAPVAPRYRHRWPWFIMLGPVAVMLATAVTVSLALRQPEAMVVDDYYKQGKAINQDLRRDRVATALQLAFDARFDAAAGTLEGRLASFGRPMLAPFRLQLAHPTQPRKDIALQVVPGPDGRFLVRLPGLAPTHWQVVAEGEGRGWRLARGWNPARQPVLHIAADAAQGAQH